MSPADRARVSAFLHHDDKSNPATNTVKGGKGGVDTRIGSGSGGGDGEGGGAGANTAHGTGYRYMASPLLMGGGKKANKKNLPVYAFGAGCGGSGGSEPGTLFQGRLKCIKMAAENAAAAEHKEKPVFGGWFCVRKYTPWPQTSKS